MQRQIGELTRALQLCDANPNQTCAAVYKRNTQLHSIAQLERGLCS